jgi:hypothetical protein
MCQEFLMSGADEKSIEECKLLKSEAQRLLKEVEKMSFFESLIDFSFSNPLYQQQYVQALQCCDIEDNGLVCLIYDYQIEQYTNQIEHL